jgi:Protein of avirulence locus involved in temperature-dependent protein secretion
MKKVEGECLQNDNTPAQPSTPAPPDYWYLTNEDGKAVGTFIPEVLGVIEVVNSDGIKVAVQLKLKLLFKDGQSREVTIPLSEIERIDWFEIDRRCFLNPDHQRAKAYIAYRIRQGLVTTDQKETLCVPDRLGIQYIDGGTRVFVAGDRIIPEEFESRFKLEQGHFRCDIDPNLTRQEEFEGLGELMSLSPEIGRVLVAHGISGIMRAAYQEARFTPCAVLVIAGESGMLKSHYVPHMIQLYNRGDGIRPDTRFNSTTRYIEDILHEHSECTAVIDDLHTAEARGIKRGNEATAEETIRRISDDTGRGYKHGDALLQKKFRGNAVFIVEYDIGKASTIPRALVVNLTEAPDGRILDKYQRQHPLLMSTFYYHFIEWYVNRFDDIRNEIDARLTKFRETAATSDVHGRLRDTQFYLQTSYLFFLEFCKESGFITEEDALDEYRFFGAQLTDLIQAQQARFRSDKTKPDGVEYLKLIRKLYKAGDFKVADNAERFDPDKHDGLIYYNCLCLRREGLDSKIRKILPGVQLNDVIQALLSKNALKLVESKYTVQIKALRFYAIHLDMLD